MKPSARVALIAALAATAPTWASLPVYSPDYTFNPTTDTGFMFYGDSGVGVRVTPDGRAASTIAHYNYKMDDLFIATWRGQMPLPTPQEDADHINPVFYGINRNGWICGYTTQTLPQGIGDQPALWRPDSSRIDLPLLSAASQGYASDVNDSGFVVGVSQKLGGSWEASQPVYWTPSSEIVELANPFPISSAPFRSGSAASISSHGVIAGTVWSGAGEQRAMRWDINGTAPILSQTTDTGITYTNTGAFESLDDGTILGAGVIGYNVYGILWTPDGDAIDLRGLPDADTQSYRSALAVNNNHYSAGFARNSQGHWVAVRWSPTGEPTILGPGAANDINDFNFVIGTGAVLWTPDGDAIDLSSLVELENGWDLTSGLSITNTGWISGIGEFDPADTPEYYNRPFSILVPFAGTYGMGDANFDESIDFADLLIVAQNYGTETNGSFDVGDFNLDGVVNFTDLLAIAQHYGDVFAFESDWEAARGMVPEPNLVGGLIGALVMLRRRSRPAGNERRTFNVEL